MPIVQAYNHTAANFAQGNFAPGGAGAYKVLLLSSASTIDLTDTTITEVLATGTEVFGGGWAEGGVALTGVATTTVTTNDAVFDANDVVVSITGTALGPFKYLVVYNTANTKPVVVVTLDADTTVLAGNDFSIIWNTNGICLFVV